MVAADVTATDIADTPQLTLAAFRYRMADGHITALTEHGDPALQPDTPADPFVPEEIARPRVSVVLLSHRPAMLRQSLDCLLSQTIPHVQIVVQYACLGWPTKLNEAVNATVGEWVLILCDDDLLHPKCLDTLLAYSNDADIVYSDRIHFADGQEPTEGTRLRMHGDKLMGPEVYKTEFLPDQFAFGSTMPMTCLIRRTLWDALGGHDPQIPHSDTEFWFRAVQAKARTIYIPEPLFYYREHSGQYSKTAPATWKAMRAFHRKHFLAFGFAWDAAYPIGDGAEWHVEVIPPDDRMAYARAHLNLTDDR